MTEASPALARFWVRVPEEDEGRVRVYRPRGWPLPPARGREGLELREDGSAVVYEIAPGDGLLEEEGHWRGAGALLEVETETGVRRRFEIVEASESVLKVTLPRG